MNINKLIIVCYKCCNIHIHVSSLTKQLLNNNNKRSTITIDITRYYMYMYDIGICVLFKKFFLSLIFEKKNQPKNFYTFLLLRNKYCLIYYFWKKSRNIIRSISPGRKRNWNSRVFSFLYSMIENWSSEKVYTYIFRQ